jgi:hypothetical protein
MRHRAPLRYAAQCVLARLTVLSHASFGLDDHHCLERRRRGHLRENRGQILLIASESGIADVLMVELHCEHVVGHGTLHRRVTRSSASTIKTREPRGHRRR